ncbi:MAG: CBS domain-containing protein [Solibacillus sp.]
MRNSDRFLTAFNRIERSIRVIAGMKEHRPFYRVLEQAKKNSPLVRKYESDLRAYADLRNAIVHNRTSPEFVIAEPHKKVVDQIEKIDEMLAKPKIVGQLFKKRVLAFQMTDSLHETLHAVRKQKYTQFPVYDSKKFKGLLTTVGITNWLASSMLGPHLPRRVPTLGDILHHEKNETNYKFISRFLTIYEAEEIFKEGVERGRRFEALLITEHGKPHQKLLGIVTPIDIMKVD